ncbi:MAG TPA: 50S ribosomal protein L22 [Chitinophagaceae bacterium]|nr:50S ribosomal protein L22 [Chitinophagaceae bacterium]
MEAVAKLRNQPTSPRKMRLLADLIRGLDVDKALNILHFHPKHPSVPLEKLVLSAIDNWKQKNENDRVEDAGLYIKVIFVDGGRMLKRMRPAPQGRGYRIRKRSNHVTIIVDSRTTLITEPEAPAAQAAVIPVEAKLTEEGNPAMPVQGGEEKKKGKKVNQLK